MSALIEKVEKNLPNSGQEYLDLLNNYSEDAWFLPTNNEEFAYFNTLFEWHLIARYTFPIYDRDSFTGTQVYFKYNHELKYH